MAPSLKKLSDNINYVFFSIFIIEMILKLVGLGCREYLKDRYNDFDCFVVMISIVEITVS